MTCIANKNGYSKKFIDLHCHLDGSITPEIARRLMEIQNITQPVLTDEELKKKLCAPKDCRNLNEFLECFKFSGSLLQTQSGIMEAVRLVADSIQQQGMIYAEIRFAPQFSTSRGLSQEDAVQAAYEGLGLTSLPCNLILCCMRGNDNRDANIETVELARKYLAVNKGVVAIDLAGAEALYSTKNFDYIFKLASEYNIPFTIHAGEADGADSIRAAIDMGASRIGHGIRLAEDPELLNEVRDKGICLEMCPTSNLITRAVDGRKTYPLKNYMEKGIKVTVNTDDMAICNTTIADEFEYIENKCHISADQERELLENAVNAAFTDNETKNKLRKEIQSEFDS